MALEGVSEPAALLWSVGCSDRLAQSPGSAGLQVSAAPSTLYLIQTCQLPCYPISVEGQLILLQCRTLYCATLQPSRGRAVSVKAREL